MVKTILEYEKTFETAIRQGQNILAKIEDQIITKSSDEIDLDNTNYDQIIYRLETSISNLSKQKVRYRFDKMSREEFNLMLKNIAERKPVTLITISHSYKLRGVDTLQLLSNIYGIGVDKILLYNNISVEDFENKVVANDTIQIPETIDLQRRNDYAELPVFGSVSGEKAWGLDLSNSLEVDSDGDLKVLSYDRTLGQGIKNMFGEFGDIPGYEDAMIDFDWGSDYASDLIDVMTLVKVRDRLLLDNRIKTINDIIINTDGNSKNIIIKVTAVNEVQPIENLIKEL